MLRTDALSAIFEKVVHGFVGVLDYFDFVLIHPDFYSDKCDVYVQRSIELKRYFCVIHTTQVS